MRRHLIVLWLGLLVAGASAEPTTASPLEAVKALARAHNAHDVEAMLANVTDDVEWLSIDGAAVSVEARGKDELRSGMTGYFKALPSARSTIESTLVSDNLVAVRERASWKSKDGEERSQAALAVYEIKDGLVARVWYYPAE